MKRRFCILAILLLCAFLLPWGADASEPEPPTDINLGTISQDITVPDGCTLTGTLGANVKISIANGATVTLSGVDINGDGTLSKDCAGLTCLGSAPLILADGTENTVRATSLQFPGIQAGSAGTTLTIQGTGALTATGGMGGAGIGGVCGISPSAVARSRSMEIRARASAATEAACWTAARAAT